MLEHVRTSLGAAGVQMTAQQRRRALRSKKGGESTTGLMVGLGTQYGLQVPGIDPAAIQRYALLAQRLQPLDTRLRVISGLVTDAVTNAKAESWEGTTALYTVLSRVAKRNASLEAELKPAVALFKKPRPLATAADTKKKGADGSGTSASPPTSATPVTAPSAFPPAGIAEGAGASPVKVGLATTRG